MFHLVCQVAGDLPELGAFTHDLVQTLIPSINSVSEAYSHIFFPDMSQNKIHIKFTVRTVEEAF